MRICKFKHSAGAVDFHSLGQRQRTHTGWSGARQRRQDHGAPVTALLACDLEFYTNFAKPYPMRPEKGERFGNDPAFAQHFSFQQCTLQGAYLIMAIRAVGPDAGAMGGFNTDAADAESLNARNWKSNFLCNIGYGNLEGIKGPRLYRYGFSQVCDII